jgi:2'-5' RNA ligase
MFDVSKRAVFGVWPEKAYPGYLMAKNKAKKGMTQLMNRRANPGSDKNFGTITKTFGKHISRKAGKQIKQKAKNKNSGKVAHDLVCGHQKGLPRNIKNFV